MPPSDGHVLGTGVLLDDEGEWAHDDNVADGQGFALYFNHEFYIAQQIRTGTGQTP